jgi:WhiB family transcriptional regulator, redox-sensing transcriptional regulator
LSLDLDDDEKTRLTEAQIDFVEMLLFGRRWLKDRACNGVPEAVFFPANIQRGCYDEAKRICATCPVQAECLADALDNPTTEDEHGVRGGLAPRERRELRQGR